MNAAVLFDARGSAPAGRSAREDVLKVVSHLSLSVVPSVNLTTSKSVDESVLGLAGGLIK